MFTGRLLAAGRPMTVEDLLAVKTVADPQVSPDGTLVVYVVTELDRDAGKSNSDLWLVPISGGDPKRLTTAPGSDNHPEVESRWQFDRVSLFSERIGAGLALADGWR